MRPWFVVYLTTVAVVSVVAGIVWNRMVDLPSYVISDDFRARITESGLSQIVATDVVYTMIGAVAGAILGVTAWLLFRELGWPVTVIATVGALVAGVLTRIVGEFMGPRHFEDRIAAATMTDLVKVDFTAHTWVPLAVWVGVAALAVLIGSLLRGPRWIAHVPEGREGADSAGEQVG
ncbi:MAG: hypothetical protein FWD75_02665 [Propionibacteriaceae bacterium]|nr:hypothetical protein [Propionibacteriaceae bacterium]